MISDPIEDITKACEDAESEAAKLQIDFVVILCKDTRKSKDHYINNYAVVAVVNLDELCTEIYKWQLMAIAKPSGLVYSWSKIPGYEEQT